MSARKESVKKSKVDNSNFTSYSYRVLKSVHPDTGMSDGASRVVNDIVNFAIRKISDAAHILRGKKVTLDAKTVQAAVRSVFPREIAKLAVSEGNKAVGKFHSSEARSPGRAGKSAKSSTSRSGKAGLIFPVARVGHRLREQQFTRLSGDAQIYLAGVLEYLVAEILNLSGNAARDNKRVRITARHLRLAINKDPELYQLLHEVMFQGGVIPHIHSRLLPTKSKKKTSDS